MKRGRVGDLIDRMQALVSKSSGERQKTMEKEVAYLIKGQQQQRLHYSQVAAIKLPIGSGAIESLIRQVVNLRLKGTGKFWLLKHAESVLHAVVSVGSGNMVSFLRLYFNGYALSSLTLILLLLRVAITILNLNFHHSLLLHRMSSGIFLWIYY